MFRHDKVIQINASHLHKLQTVGSGNYGEVTICYYNGQNPAMLSLANEYGMVASKTFKQTLDMNEMANIQLIATKSCLHFVRQLVAQTEDSRYVVISELVSLSPGYSFNIESFIKKMNASLREGQSDKTHDAMSYILSYLLESAMNGLHEFNTVAMMFHLDASMTNLLVSTKKNERGQTVLAATLVDSGLSQYHAMQKAKSVIFNNRTKSMPYARFNLETLLSYKARSFQSLSCIEFYPLTELFMRRVLFLEMFATTLSIPADDVINLDNINPIDLDPLFQTPTMLTKKELFFFKRYRMTNEAVLAQFYRNVYVIAEYVANYKPRDKRGFVILQFLDAFKDYLLQLPPVTENPEDLFVTDLQLFQQAHQKYLQVNPLTMTIDAILNLLGVNTVDKVSEDESSETDEALTENDELSEDESNESSEGLQEDASDEEDLKTFKEPVTPDKKNSKQVSATSSNKESETSLARSYDPAPHTSPSKPLVNQFGNFLLTSPNSQNKRAADDTDKKTEGASSARRRLW